MSSQVPNPATRSLTITPFLASLSVHPDYTYWAEYWEIIRDAEVGEVEIKRKAQKYLPKLPSHDAQQYKSYLQRAVFFNMTSRTLNALYGTVFNRAPKVSGFDPKLTEAARKIAKDGTSLHLLAKTTVKEVLAVGRYGLLVDAKTEENRKPFITSYTAENILDWTMDDINGEHQLARVVLREIYYDRSEPWQPYQYRARFRVLSLADGVYRQFIYEGEAGAMSRMPDIDAEPDYVITPTVRGDTLDYIPFVCVGPFTNHPDVAKPPMLDIVTLNLSHYLSYAQLEQGRFYTGAPIYTVQSGSRGNDSDTGEYIVGPDVVWELGTGEEAKILEFNGQGLRFLENALGDKEAQISAIGGRLMPGNSRGAAESDNSLALKERNEQTMLLNIADTVDEALTRILRWWADWSNVPKDKVKQILFELNRDFMMKNIGAREFRAIQQMYENGIIPVDVVFEYLRKAEVIPDWMDEHEFKRRLNDTKQFPNMVDVLARMKDFPDAKSFHEFETQKQAMSMGGTNVNPGGNDPEQVGVPKQANDARGLNQQRRKQAAQDKDDEKDGNQ